VSNIVCFSGGKDSTAMLLRMLELKMPIDRIVFADTGFEFPELYEYIERIEKHIGRKIERVYPEKSFENWFYGKSTRGKSEGQTRGFPLRIYPCYWSREAKIKPLTALQKEGDNVFIGIAFDEQERMQKETNLIKYPLVEWRWTEQKCIDYLNEKNLFNPLYVNFDRLGCFFCPKQNEKSIYVLWKNYPDLWKKTKYWENEQKKLNGRTIFDKDLSFYEKQFEKGVVPKRLPKYKCWNGCESVKKAFLLQQTNLGCFETRKIYLKYKNN
jgi:3'-phosphoadenosine 5'-phosphosulfate sulfotransferase (PAPS reductase)/FAD synthetase